MIQPLRDDLMVQQQLPAGQRKVGLLLGNTWWL
jgi:hypothetical protein